MVPSTFYKGLGFAVWKAGTWYLRRRYGTASRRWGIGMLGTVALAAGLAAVLRRNDDAA
jgi:hypothetical protein